MIARWRAWVTFLDRSEPAEALALYRVGLGLNVLWAMLSVWLPGMVPMLWMQPEDGGMRPLPDDGSWLVAWLGGPSPEVVWPLVWATTLAAALLTAGVGSRWMAFVCLQGFGALAWINGHAGGSYDNLITNALWLLVLAESDATLSLRARWRAGTWRPEAMVRAWPRWLITLQLLVMYCSTGLHKVSATWVPGGEHSALYFILQQPSWARADWSAAAQVYPLTQAATLSVWLFEVGSPLLLLVLWFRHTRTRPGRLRAWSNRLRLRDAFVVYGVAMHLGIHALMAVGPFSTVAVCLYAALFSGDEWRASLNRWGRRRGAAASRPAPTTPSPRGATGLPPA